MTESIAILDFGSQYAQIIARRVREANVYCELFPWDAPQERILSINPKGFILSGGKASGDVGKSYVGDAGIQHLHERSQRDGERDQPRIVAWLPRLCRAHLTKTFGSTPMVLSQSRYSASICWKRAAL